MRHLVRRISGVCGLAVLVSAWAAPPGAAVVSTTSARPFLLGTIEFRGIARGGWYEFADKVAEALDLLSRCAESADRCPKRDILALLAETAKLRGQERYQILAAVNRLANRRPYRSDLANFHRSEYWASPLEFLANSGDCEDYAIFKYALLRHLGVPADSLRVVLAKRKADGLGHAVLAAYLDDKVYILDSASGRVRPQSEVTNYTAVFSFNENARWAHIASAPDAVAAPGASTPKRVLQRRDPGFDGLQSGSPESDLFTRLYTAVFAPSRPDPDAYRVQLGAFRSLEHANELWQRVWRTQWDLLGQAEPEIHSLDIGAKGQLHLLQIGAMASAQKAETLCKSLSDRGVDCFVVRPAGRAAADART